MKKAGIIDIPRWLSTLILSTLSLCIPVYVYLVNPSYLTSMEGYANGVETYTFTMEALQVRKLLGKLTSNFWLDGGSLGYPLFLKTQPVPCFFTAILMMLFERLSSPLCVVRWLIVFLLALLPWTWYKGSRSLHLSRTQSVSLALLILTVDSQLQTGFELDAFLLHGYLPQLFAMVVLPLAVSKIYLYILQLNSKDERQAVFFLTLTYLCDVNVAFYCSLLSLLTMLLSISANEFTLKHTKQAATTTLKLHAFVLLYVSWWCVPLFISYVYTYNGMLSSSTSSTMSLTGLVDMYTNGNLFSYRQKYQMMTFLVAVGLLVAVKNLRGFRHFNSLQFNPKHLFSTWLLMATGLSVFLTIETSLMNAFRTLVPCQLNDGSRSFVFGVHFCGVVLASLAIAQMVWCLQYTLVRFNFKRRLLSGVVVGVMAMFLIRVTGFRVSDRVTLVEVSKEFVNTLRTVSKMDTQGRMLVHEKFGTGGPWDMVNIPYLTHKSGVFLPGNSRNSIATSFYLDSLLQRDSSTLPQFHNILSLYNIHYLVASASVVDNNTPFDIRHFQRIANLYDMNFYQVKGLDRSFTYFDVVRLPGYVEGSLNRIYQPVSGTLDLFSRQVLFYINPGDCVKKESIINAKVGEASVFEKLFGSKSVSLVHWQYEGEETNSEEALKSLNEYYKDKWTTSLVLEEKHEDNEYHVIVHITKTTPQNLELAENLLLKVSYHPFWRCHYTSVPEDYTLDDYKRATKTENRHRVSIDHVTPNMMSVRLPPGRHHVVFRYRFPGILKLMAVILTLMLIDSTFNKRRIARYVGKCCSSMYFAQLLFGKEAGRTIVTIAHAAYLACKQQNFATTPDAPFGKILETPFCKVLTSYTSKLSPYLMNFKLIGGIAWKGVEMSVRSYFSKQPQGDDVTDDVTKRKKKVQYDVESSPEKISLDESSLHVPRAQHVKKSVRKKRLKRTNHEGSPTLRHTTKNAVQEVADDVDDAKAQIRRQRVEDARREEMMRRSNTLVSCPTPTDDVKDSEPEIIGERFTNSEMDLICGADGLQGKSCTRSVSPSPEVPDDVMGTEDCYISDSYMYNSELSVEDYGDDHDALLDNELFRTTWIPENDGEDDDLDLNKSIEISFSPLSSGSSTPSDCDDVARDLSEFSSSPDEHSSLDDSVEYRKDFSNLEELTSRKGGEVPVASQMYWGYASDSVQVDPNAHTKGFAPHAQSD